IGVLLVRELDVEADGEAAALPRTAVGRLHYAWPAPGDDREAGLGEAPRHAARGLVRRVALPDARGAEDRHRRPVDPGNGLEACEKLLPDPHGVGTEVAVVAALEKATVLH